MQNKIRILQILVIIFVASIVRFWQDAGPLTLDEAEYALAARHGIVANALDLENLNQSRHYHGPGQVYLIRLSTLLFGDNELAVRLPAYIVSILTCVLLLFIGWRIRPDNLWFGFVAAFLLAINPVHAQVGRIANMHSTCTFLTLLVFFFLLQGIKTGKWKYFYLFSATIALYLATMEYGLVLLFIAGVTLLIFPNPVLNWRSKPIFISKNLLVMILIMFGVFLLIWPAGVIKVDLLRNFVYYLKYAHKGHPIQFLGSLTRHVPGWAYLYWHWVVNPVFFVLSIVAVVYLFAKIARRRATLDEKVLAVFIGILTLVLLKQHVMSIRYSVYIVPFLSIATAMLLYAVYEFVPSKILFGSVLLLIFITNVPKFNVISPGEQGYRRVSEYLQQEASPEAKILAWYKSILSYYLPDFVNLQNYNTGSSTPDLRKQISAREFDYIILYENQKKRWPDDPAYALIEDNYNLLKTYYWREIPKLWLYHRKVNGL